MHWVVEYIDGSSKSEREYSFSSISKENIKAIYFEDKGNKYGCINGNKFFINNKEFDFKINKVPHKYFQFKTASLLLNKEAVNDIQSWNLGFEVYTHNGFEKYTLSINKKFEVYFIAQKFDVGLNKLDERKLRLQ